MRSLYPAWYGAPAALRAKFIMLSDGVKTLIGTKLTTEVLINVSKYIQTKSDTIFEIFIFREQFHFAVDRL